jgi:hypothetical protein
LRVADGSIAQSHGADAVLQLSSASALWADGARAAQARAAAAASRQVLPPAPVPATPPAVTKTPAESAVKPPADPRPDIERVIAAYANAIESGSVDEIRRAYPGLTAAQQQGWEVFFRSVRNFKATLIVDQLTANGNSADAGINATYVYENRSTGRPDRQQFHLQAALSRAPGGWRLDSIH